MNADIEALTKSPERSLDLFDFGLMIKPEQSVDLFAMPMQPSRKFGARYMLTPRG
jgi:hypothetical protein